MMCFSLFKVKDQQEAEKKKVTSMDIQATIEVKIYCAPGNIRLLTKEVKVLI